MRSRAWWLPGRRYSPGKKEFGLNWGYGPRDGEAEGSDTLDMLCDLWGGQDISRCRQGSRPGEGAVEPRLWFLGSSWS